MGESDDEGGDTARGEGSGKRGNKRAGEDGAARFAPRLRAPAKEINEPIPAHRIGEISLRGATPAQWQLSPPRALAASKQLLRLASASSKQGMGEVGAEGDRFWKVGVVEEKGWVREVEELDREGLDSKQGTRGERKGDEGKRTKGADKEVEGLDVEEVKLREEKQLDVEGLDNKHARGKENGDEIESTKGAGQEVGELDVDVAGKLDPRGSTGQRKSDQGKKKRGRRILRLGTINCHTRVEINREQLLYTLSEVAGVDICAVTETFLKEEDRPAIQFMTEESGYSWIGRERLGRKGGGKGFFYPEIHHLERRQHPSDTSFLDSSRSARGGRCSVFPTFGKQSRF